MNDMSVIVEENAVLARIYARLPLDVQMSLTPEQTAALGLATYDLPTPHKVAIRKTFGIFGRRTYFALFMGSDRRANRQSAALNAYADEFRADWRYLLGILVTLAVIVSTLGAAATTAWYYAADAVGGAYRPVAVEELKPVR
jgi:hypothetical protein